MNYIDNWLTCFLLCMFFITSNESNRTTYNRCNYSQHSIQSLYVCFIHSKFLLYLLFLNLLRNESQLVLIFIWRLFYEMVYLIYSKLYHWLLSLSHMLSFIIPVQYSRGCSEKMCVYISWKIILACFLCAFLKGSLEFLLFLKWAYSLFLLRTSPCRNIFACVIASQFLLLLFMFLMLLLNCFIAYHT